MKPSKCTGMEIMWVSEVVEFVGGGEKAALIFSIRNRNLQSARHISSDLTSFASFYPDDNRKWPGSSSDPTMINLKP